MKKITSKQLLELGFIREEGESFHYYIYEINGNALFISCSNDEKVNGGYLIEFYEHEDIRLNDINDVKTIIEIINKNK